MRVKILLGAIALAAASSVLVAASSASAQNASQTLSKVVQTKVFTIGHRESAIPLSFFDDSQKPVGFVVDLCAQVAEAVKNSLRLPQMEVKFVPVSASTRIPLIANGTIDLECGSTTNNVERQRQVAFSVTTFVAANRYASKRVDALSTLSDLRGRPVTSTSGSNNIQQIIALNSARSLGLTILPAKDHAEGFLMLETGRARAFVMDDILLAGLIANAREPAAYVVSPEALSVEPYAIMMRMNDPSFKDLVDATLGAAYRSGAIETLYKKWFESPIPPRGINLNLPPSAALRKVWQTPTDSPDPAAYQ
jgi:glutamate/aspartate transport system substrate-binding protein